MRARPFPGTRALRRLPVRPERTSFDSKSDVVLRIHLSAPEFSSAPLTMQVFSPLRGDASTPPI